MRQLTSEQHARRVDVYEAIEFETALRALDRSVEAYVTINTTKRHRALERERRDRRAVPRGLRHDLLTGSAACVYCGDFATCLDHVIPIAQLGTSDRDNLAPACTRCNTEKLDWTPERWREWRLTEGMCWPPLSVRVWLTVPS